MNKTEVMDLFEIIQSKILINFPSLNVEIYHEENEDEYFISIDDSDIYYTNSYQELITLILIKVIWPKNIVGIYFIYDDRQHFSNLSYSFENINSLTEQYEYESEYFLSLSDTVNIFPLIDKAA